MWEEIPQQITNNDKYSKRDQTPKNDIITKRCENTIKTLNASKLSTASVVFWLPGLGWPLYLRVTLQARFQ